MNPEPRAELVIGTDERSLLRIRIRSLIARSGSRRYAP